MGRGTNTVQDALMTDAQIDTSAKTAGQQLFSADGKAPGNNLYRAVTGIIGAAFGMYLTTFFGIFGMVNGKSSGKFALVVYIICLVLGIGAIRWAYKKFRYGGEVEEGTGIIKVEPLKKKNKQLKQTTSFAKGIGVGSLLGAAVDIIDD